MKFLILTGLFAFLILIFDFPSAHAWKFPVEVSTITDDGTKLYNKLVVGIEPSATDGFDNLWDAPALVSNPDPDSPILLRVYINGKGSGAEEIKYLWKDIRGTGTKGDTVWDITVDSVPAGRAVVISWDAPQGLLKAGEQLVLKDHDAAGADGATVEADISGRSRYLFISDGEGSRSLSLVYSKEAVESSRSGGGSGFGCGRIRPYQDDPPDGGTEALGILALFSPLLFVRLLRLVRNEGVV